MEQTKAKKNFSNQVREIVNNISLHATTHEHYDVIPQENSDDMVLVVTNRTYLLDFEEIALALSSADFIVRYMKGTNFLMVEKNNNPTPAALPGMISCIPISFAEALDKLKEYSDAIEVVHPDETEVNCATVIAKQGSRNVLSEIAYLLSSGGMYVSFVEGCNFLEFEECLEYEVSPPIIRIKNNFRPNVDAVLSVDKVAMG